MTIDQKAKLKRGERVRVFVNSTPCIVTMNGTLPLTQTTWGVLEKTYRMPAGPIHVVMADDGTRFAIDGNDLKNGSVALQVWEGAARQLKVEALDKILAARGHDSLPLYDDPDEPCIGFVHPYEACYPLEVGLWSRVAAHMLLPFHVTDMARERPLDLLKIICSLQLDMTISSEHMRYEIPIFSETGAEQPSVFFSIRGDVPPEHEGREETVLYDFCSKTAEHAKPVTVYRWGTEAAMAAHEAIDSLAEQVRQEMERTAAGGDT